MSRAEALKILLEASGLEMSKSEVDFKDVLKGTWYEKYIALSQELAFVDGYEDGTFRPDNKVTRAEIAKITVKLMEAMEL